MARVDFTPNLARYLACGALEVPGRTVRDVLARSCEMHPGLRGYLLDDQGRLRRHVTVFVDGVQIKDRKALSDAVAEGSSVFVVQALSGG